MNTGKQGYEALGRDLGHHINQSMQRILMRHLSNDTPREKIEIDIYDYQRCKGSDDEGTLEAERQNPGDETN